MELKLTLDTDYKTTGNSSGMQIDTLAMAIDGMDWDALRDMNHLYLCEIVDSHRADYDHTDDFLATLNADQRASYADNLAAFQAALKEYAKEIDEQESEHELDDEHPYFAAIEEASGDAEEYLRREWLYGDRSEAGLIVRASRKLSDILPVQVALSYNEKEDALTLSIDEEEEYQYFLEQFELKEELAETQSYADLADEYAAETKRAEYALSELINSRARSSHDKNIEDAKARRKERERVAAYKKEQKAQADAELRAKIIGENN